MGAPERSLEKLLGERLRSFRLLEGLTQRELAERVAGGVDLSYIGRIERGEQLPSLKVLQKLGRALGASVGDFFGRRAMGPGGRAARAQLALWRTLEQVSPQDASILLGIARLLTERRKTAAGYRGRLPAGSVAAERRLRYRGRRATRRSARAR